MRDWLVIYLLRRGAFSRLAYSTNRDGERKSVREFDTWVYVRVVTRATHMYEAFVEEVRVWGYGKVPCLFFSGLFLCFRSSQLISLSK